MQCEFQFYYHSDVQKQKKMKELTKERDKLIEKINTFASVFNTMSQKLKDAQGLSCYIMLRCYMLYEHIPIIVMVLL